MNLTLKRTFTGDGVTLGELFIDGAFFCFTLEPDDVGVPHPAIPLGTYRIIIDYSVRFKRRLPLVVNVPGRLGIRIHPGNTAAETEGCILLGLTQVGQRVEHSRDACAAFTKRIRPVLAANQSVTLTVELAEQEGAKRA